MLKTKQRSKSERYNAFTEEVNKIVLSSNNDKRMQPIDSVEVFAYGMSKDLVSEKEENKCNKTIQKWSTLIKLQKQK